jgi:hypothetical protein
MALLDSETPVRATNNQCGTNEAHEKQLLATKNGCGQNGPDRLGAQEQAGS